jgi:DNA-binding MarR family transcriptional regulator
MTELSGLSDLVDRLGRITHALQFAAGLNPVQWEALRYLNRANKYSCSPSALAEYLGSTKGTVSQTLIALEGKGYVRRARDAVDRRSVKIALTDSGRALLGDDPLRVVERAGGELSAADRHDVIAGMERLLGVLNQTLGKPGFGICTQCCYLDTRPGRDEPDNCVCGLTSEPLSRAETEMICINFATAPAT